MKKVFSWFNKKGFLVILAFIAMTVITEFLYRGNVLRVYLGNHTLNVWFLFVTIGLVLFVLVIFAPLYRKFGVQELRTINKGKHYPKRIRWPIFVNFKDYFRIELKVRFDPNCVYNFGNEDNHDKNKLFGLSFTLLPRIRHKDWIRGGDVRIWFRLGNYIVIKPHHWNSVRFGWNVSPNMSQLLLTPYIFRNGKRVSRDYFSNNVGDWISFDTDKYYRFILNVRKETREVRMVIYDNSGSDLYLDFDKIILKVPKWKVVYYYLDLYFGGNRTAPHTMHLEQQQIVD